jgi:hypothetical protein
VSVDGPSIRAYLLSVLPPPSQICLDVKHTRLWSMISTIAASLPSEGPPWMRAMRPTSTSLHDEALISASPIVIDSEGE